MGQLPGIIEKVKDGYLVLEPPKEVVVWGSGGIY